MLYSKLYKNYESKHSNSVVSVITLHLLLRQTPVYIYRGLVEEKEKEHKSRFLERYLSRAAAS